LLKGYLEKGYYNIGLHLIAEAFQQLYIKEHIEWKDDIWMTLEEISSIPKTSIDDYIGIPVTNPWPVAVHHQLMYQGSQIQEVLHYMPQFANASNVVI
jgi:hypothetical protein